MKRTLHLVLTLVLGTLLPTSIMAETIPLVGNVLERKITSLNGDWNYIVDVQEEGYYDYRMNPTSWGFFRNAKPQRPEDLIEYDFDTSPTMPIPSDWNTRDERLFFYEGTVWFKKSFDWHPTQGRNTLLYFGAVNYDCHVYVNGTKVGHHIGGFTAFNFDVTQQLKEGENTVIVKVDNKRHAEDVPTQIFDWWNYGGITRDVKLVKVTPVYLEDYSLQMRSEKREVKSEKYREICFSAKLSKAEAGHEVTVSIPELKIKQTFTTDAEGKVQSSKFKVQSTAPSKHATSRFCSTASPSSSRASASTTRSPTAADVPTPPKTPVSCSHGPRNWVATSCVWHTIRTMNIWYARLSVWASSCGLRFPSTGLSPGRIPPPSPTPSSS